jgi:hypothetical protein
MNKRNFFPYNNRLLGAESLIFEKSERRNPENLAIVALANVKSGDIILVDDCRFEITRASKDIIEITVGDNVDVLNQDNYMDSKIIEGLTKAIALNINSRIDSIEQIIERDPALYRARTGGWVLIDELVRMTGNIQYCYMDNTKPKDIDAVKNKTASIPPELKPITKDDQMGFEF